MVSRPRLRCDNQDGKSRTEWTFHFHDPRSDGAAVIVQVGSIVIVRGVVRTFTYLMESPFMHANPCVLIAQVERASGTARLAWLR